ncbi:MAG: PH domain-containing protein, partial [Candidatus Marinimicrobia bacterium]|nr:PH domain-containing protein [Candidatus Neomarinimicrobiota bacterium]
YTKCLWILITVTVSILVSMAITHLIVNLAGGETKVVEILWLICIAGLIVTWIISFPLIQLWIKNLTYLILDDRVTVHKGILTKTQQNIPYRSITDFVLVRSIYDRLLGIGSIKIQTAGQSTTGTGYEGHLAGLKDYEELHADLRTKIKGLHPISGSVATGEPAIKPDDNILYHILSEVKEIRRHLDK